MNCPPAKIMTFVRSLGAVLCVGFLCLLPAKAFALTVQDIRFGQHPGKTRIVLDLDQKADFHVSVRQAPWRLVIQLPAGFAGPDKGGSMRTGDIQSVSRDEAGITIGLRSAQVVRSAYILPRSDGKPDRLVIDIAPVSGQSGAAGQAQNGFGGSPYAPLPRSAAEKAAVPLPIPAPRPHLTEASAVSGAATTALPRRKPEPGAPSRGDDKPLIVLDAGHGGIDPGAMGANGIHEKHITLAVAKELKKQLEGTGRYRVFMTRERDTYLRLNKRVELARKKDADLFISLHADSIGKPGIRGASVYTLSEKASDEQTEMLAQRENRADLIAGVDLSAEDQVVANILVDLAMRDSMNQSKFMAGFVVDRLAQKGIRVLDNPQRAAGFAVLKAPDIPSVLIEMGFMSNKSEVELLSTTSFQRLLASALVSGIDAYFAKSQLAGAI